MPLIPITSLQKLRECATVGTVIDQIKAKHIDAAKQELLSGKFDQVSREVIRLLVRCKAMIRRDGSAG